MEYVKTTDKADEDKKREALIAELKSIDSDLKKSEGPYVGGQDVNAADLKLGPQLKHVIIGSKAVKVRSLSSALPCVTRVWLSRFPVVYQIQYQHEISP